MRSFIAAAALVAGALAQTPACMSTADALVVANNFRSLIGEPFSESLANDALAENFTDYSDSVIELINSGCANGPIPLGSATFTSRTAFIAGQSAQPPIPFEILNVWNNCDTVFLRWRSANPGFVQPEQIVTGNIVLETVASSGAQPFQIATVYSEFNSGAWLADIGNLTCTATAPA